VGKVVLDCRNLVEVVMGSLDDFVGMSVVIVVGRACWHLWLWWWYMVDLQRYNV